MNKIYNKNNKKRINEIKILDYIRKRMNIFYYIKI